MQDTILKIQNISKFYPGVTALNNVSFEIKAGEARALCGENGAGKSTLIKCIMGVERPDEGKVLMNYNGDWIENTSALEAQSHGVYANYQHVNIAPDLSIAENYFLGRQPRTKLGMVDWKKMYDDSQKIIDKFGMNVDPRQKISSLPIAMQAMVTISKISVSDDLRIISNALTVTGIDQRILSMGNTNVFGVLPVLAIIWAIVAIIIWFILKYAIFGRSLYVLGSGVEVAKLSGIKVRKMFYATYAGAGLLYGIAGIMLAARVQSALPTGGEGYDMNAIAAAVIGGASLAGGKGTVTGTVLGTILMVLINNAGVQFGLNTHVLEITSGVLIIFAVTMDMLKNRKKA